MLLYLVRHAIAQDRGAMTAPADDGLRELTPAGIKKMRHHARVLKKLGMSVGEIWTSPLVRAKHTADLLAAGLGCAAPIRLVEALAPDGSSRDLLVELRKCAHDAGIALVGHEPYMSEFAAELLSARRTEVAEFKKGGAACFEIDEFGPPPRARLQWLLTPKVMGLMS